MSTHTLTFTNLVGNFTVDKEMLGSQDPYVVFSAGGRKAQTKAIKGVGAGTCDWRETYTLEEFAPRNSTMLEVVVYNHNTLRPDAVIGSGTVDLANLGENQLTGSNETVSVPLVDKKDKNVGTLKFRLHGGGYNGRSSTGTGGRSTGAGTGAGTGVAAGAAGAGAAGMAGSGHHHHHGHHSNMGRDGDDVVGVGAGSDKHSAKEAAKEAAREDRDVAIDTNTGVGAGKPVDRGVDNTRTTGPQVGHGNESGEVIDRKYYTGTENRPQDQALVEKYREHNPYAKEYETTVQHTGRERQVGSNIEAVGTEERVIGGDHHIHGHPHQHIERNLPSGAMAQRPAGEGWVEGKPGPICDSKTFSVTGDRTVDKERVTNLVEDREFEKEFEVKTALKGEHQMGTAVQPEMLNRERVLVGEKPKNACAGHPDVDAATGNVGGAGYGTRGTTGATDYATAGDAGYGNTGAESGYGTTGNTGTGYGTSGNRSGTGVVGRTADAATGGHGPGTAEESTGPQGNTSMLQRAKNAVTGGSNTGNTTSNRY